MKHFATLANFNALGIAPLTPTDRGLEYDGDFDPGKDPRNRISTTVQIGGRWFHYEAFRLAQDPEELRAYDPALQKDVDAVAALCGDTPRAVQIDGEYYVEVFFPFAS